MRSETDTRNDLGLATVGIVTIKKEVINSSDFLAGKAGDPARADKAVQQIWSNKKTTQLKEHLTDDSIFLTMPSSTRTNVIPIQLAQYLSQKTGIPWIDGDSIFNAKHNIASKNISRDKKVFNKRKYSVSKNKNINSLQNKKIIVVDDIIASGSSIRNFSEFLRSYDLNIYHIVGLMGDRRFEIDKKTENKLKDLLNQKNIGVDFEKIGYITRTEAGGLIRLLNNTRSDNAIRKLTESLHGIQRHGAFTNIKRTSGADRNKSTRGKDRGNVRTGERIQTYSSPSSIKWELKFIKNDVIVKTIKVETAADLDKKNQLKKLQDYIRKIVVQNKLGLVQVKMKEIGKVVHSQREKKQSLKR